MFVINFPLYKIRQCFIKSIRSGIKVIFIILVCITSFQCSSAKYIPAENIVKLTVKFGDPRWNGITIPPGEDCKRCGEFGHTPALIIEDIPDKANAIIMEYCDRSYQLMNNGGHGIIGYWLEPNTSRVIIPSVPGHTFDLPEKFFLVSEHIKGGMDKPGAYLPPCSCRGGNSYSVKVKAVYQAKSEGETSLLLGEYELILGTDI